MTLAVHGRLGDAIARPALAGLANAYNVGAAIAAGLAIGRAIERSAAAIDGYAGPFGRLEWIEIDGRHLLVILIKNTVSLAETVRLSSALAADVVLIGLNDAPADGRDVSWIWDAPISALVGDRTVILTGNRAADIHLRLKYDREAGATAASSITEVSSLAAALDLAIAGAPPRGIVIAAATYTAMMGLRRIVERRGAALPAPH